MSLLGSNNDVLKQHLKKTMWLESRYVFTEAATFLFCLEFGFGLSIALAEHHVWSGNRIWCGTACGTLCFSDWSFRHWRTVTMFTPSARSRGTHRKKVACFSDWSFGFGTAKNTPSGCTCTPVRAGLTLSAAELDHSSRSNFWNSPFKRCASKCWCSILIAGLCRRSWLLVWAPTSLPCGGGAAVAPALR